MYEKIDLGNLHNELLWMRGNSLHMRRTTPLKVLTQHEYFPPFLYSPSLNQEQLQNKNGLF